MILLNYYYFIKFLSKRGSSGSSLKDYGHYIKDDKFRIRSIDSGERIARTRTFFLFEKALIICKSKGDLYNYKEALLIDEYIIEDPSVTPNSNSSSLDLSSGAVNLSMITSGANAHMLTVYNSNRTKVSTNVKYYGLIVNKKSQKESTTPILS